MVVRLYTNTSHYKTVDKSGRLTLRGEFDAVLKEPTSLLNPTLTISKSSVSSIANVNYMYIPDFNRWYFAKITVLTAGMIQVDGEVDALMSQSNGIRGLRCQVTRQENTNNMMLPDPDIPTLAKRNITYMNFSSTPFSANPQGAHYVLTVSGSSAISNDAD